MDFRPTIKILSRLMLLMGLALGAVALYAYLAGESEKCQTVFYSCAAGVFFTGLVGELFSRRHPRESQLQLAGVREGYLIVTLSWVLAIAVGALPLLLTADLRLADACFESASGMTTTGATIITPELLLRTGETLAQKFPEIARDPTLLRLPNSLLLWRAILNWLGGCGIIFFVLLVVPFSTFGKGLLLYNAEVPGLKNDESVVTSLKGSIDSVAILYLTLTFLALGFFRLGGMEWFDAVCHALATVSTGGFSTRSASLGYYSSAIQWIAIGFMMLSACNFSLLLKLFLHRDTSLFRDEEFRCFLSVFLLALLSLTAMVYWSNPNGLPIIDAQAMQPRSVPGYLRTVAFQLATILSTTGFVTSDYELWHCNAALFLLIAVMFPCGCGGSTAGGMKFSRVVVVAKHLAGEIRHCIFPHAVADVRFNGIHLDNSLVSKTLAFTLLYFALWGFSSFLLILLEGNRIDINTACGASLATLGNIGPGLGRAGASGNFAWMGAPAKLLLILNMVTGRLELYTILVLFAPQFWKTQSRFASRH